MMKLTPAKLLPGLIFLAALAVRVWVTWEGCSDPTRICRPDTATYLEPAAALLEGNFYGTGRAPGYIWLAALLKSISGNLWYNVLAAAGALLGALTVFPVYCSGKLLAGNKAGVIAASLWALNLTAIANAPMLLSDTLFGFFAAWQLFFMLAFYRCRKGYFFVLTLLVAAIGTLTRPINLFWFLPALFLLGWMPGMDMRKKLTAALGGILIFWAVILPWMARNASSGAPWCIDTNTGAMLHQNGAMILAEVKNSSYEAEKRKIIAHFDELFKDKKRFPDEKSREEWKIARLKEIIRQYPLTALKQHFNLHRILLPDAPTFFELLGLTRSDRGTMDVLKQKGLIAAVDHYFDGSWKLPLLLLPVLMITAFTYIGTLAAAIWSVWHFRKRFFLFLLILAFAEYYLFLPGPICAPRYQIPALPVMCIMAAMMTVLLLRYRRLRRS